MLQVQGRDPMPPLSVKRRRRRSNQWVYQDPRWRPLREAALKRDGYQCRRCKVFLQEGRREPESAVVHHVEPVELRPDLAFELDNLESVCKLCHDGDLAREELQGYSDAIDASGMATDPRHPANTGKVIRKWGFSIPDGLEASGIPVTIVCGAPGAGKSRYVDQHASAGDVIIDIDRIKVELGGEPWDQDRRMIARSLAYRAEMLRGLAERKRGRAWLIITAPSELERRTWLQALGRRARLHVMPTTEAQCIRNIKADRRRGEHVGTHVSLARRWFRVR